LGHPGPRIAQYLPFLRNDPSPMPLRLGYVIGTIEQEATGRDTTLLRLECHAEASRARLQSLLRQAGFHAQILAGSRETAKTLPTRLLVANKGFVAPGDERLPGLAKLAGDAIESVALVGGYADPIEAAAKHEP
jgi:hypothetical protein